MITVVQGVDAKAALDTSAATHRARQNDRLEVLDSERCDHLVKDGADEGLGGEEGADGNARH